jgi:hypothetical protein
MTQSSRRSVITQATERRWLVGLAAVGLLWRLALAAHIYAAFRPGTPTAGDADLYLKLAENLLAGHGYTMDSTPPHDPFVFRPPSYPFFLAGLLGLSGGSHAAAVTVQVLLDLATGFLLFFLARRLWPSRPRLPLLVFGLWATCPAVGSLAGRLVAEVLATFLITGGILLLALGAAARRWRGLVLCAAGGAGLMLGVLARPQLVPVILLVPLLIAAFRPPASGRRHSSATPALLVAAVLGVLVVEGPWVARNLRAVGEPVFLSGGLGELVFAMGVTGEPRWETMTEAEESMAAEGLVVSRDPVERYRDRHRYVRFALERIRQNPLHYLTISLRRAVLMWATPRTAIYGVSSAALRSAVRHPLASESRRPLLVAGLFGCYYAILLGLAVLAAIRHRRDAALRAILIALPIAVTVIDMWLYLEARYVLPTYPAIVLAAALWLDDRFPKRVQPAAGA